MRHYLLVLLFPLISWVQPTPLPRIFMIGDSTMADKPTEDNPERGWGQMFRQFFEEGVEVKNYAVNGRSTKSFIDEHRWDSVLKKLKPGDWVVIQFGHNDAKKEDTTRYAAAHGAYKDNLLRFVKEARAMRAKPVLVTPVQRRRFDSSGAMIDLHGDYPGVVRQLAEDYNVPLVDLHKSSTALIVQQGVKGSEKMFRTTPAGHYKMLPEGITDNTHFSVYGATLIAGLVAAEIKNKDIELAEHLRKLPFEGKYQFDLPVIYEPHFRRDTISIVAYGAKADGVTLNSKSINAAIDACSSKGGGVVMIPPGLWLSGPVVLKSNVNLYLAPNAILQFTKDFDQYPLVETTYEGLKAMRCQAPVSALNAENIAITGKGILDGSGDAWRAVKKDKLTESQWSKLVASGGIVGEDQKTWYPSVKSQKGAGTKLAGVLAAGKTAADFNDIKDFLRPNMISITSCKNVLLEGVTFQNSPAWCIHPLLCEHITLKDVYAKNPWYAQNGDGLDLESCRYARIDGCTFDVGDDGICIKSGRDEEGRKRGVPTEDVIVTNSTVYHAHGGFVIGSEMSGGARNIYVSDCSFLGTDIGLRFKTTRGRGGIVEKIYVNNINMKEIPAEAILFDMYYMAKDPVVLKGDKRETPKVELLPVTDATPRFRDFHISNVVCYGAEKALFIRGLPEMPISDIYLDNIVIKADKAGDVIAGSNINLSHMKLITSDGGKINGIKQ